MTSRRAMSYEKPGLLARIWSVLVRNRWSILGFASIATIAAAAIVYVMTPVYTAQTTILIEPRVTTITTVDEIYSLESQNTQFYETQFRIMRARPMVEAVVGDLELARYPEFDPDLLDRGQLNALASWLPFELPRYSDRFEYDPLEIVIDAYFDKLTIKPLKNTQLVNLRFDAQDPALAATIANHHAAIYLQSLRDAAPAISTATVSAPVEAEPAQQEPQAEEPDVQPAVEESDPDGDVLRSVSAREINELTAALREVRQELARSRTEYRKVFTADGQLRDDVGNVPAISSDPRVQALASAELAARHEAEELSRRYGPQHPRMLEARKKLDMATSELRAQWERAAEGLSSGYEHLVAEEAELIAALDRSKEMYQKIVSQQKQASEAKAAAEVRPAAKESLAVPVETAAVAGMLREIPARVISKAVAPIFPSKPKKPEVIGIVFASSLLLATLFAFVVESINQTIRSPAEIPSKLATTMLGIIPLLNRRRTRFTPLGNMFLSEKEPEFNEAIRTIRTSIALDNMQHPHKVIVVASSIGGEGKSTVALNLAHAFGQLEEQKILLIDADMRRPAIANELNIATHIPGLAELLSGKTPLAKCLFRSVKYNMDVLTAGLLPKDPLELLSSERFVNALMVLRKKYDRIIIDTPPLHAVSDGLVPAKQADSVIFVVKPGAASVRQINQSLDRLIQVDARVSGVVLNQLDMQKAGLYGGYAYATG